MLRDNIIYGCDEEEEEEQNENLNPIYWDRLNAKYGGKKSYWIKSNNTKYSSLDESCLHNLLLFCADPWHGTWMYTKYREIICEIEPYTYVEMIEREGEKDVNFALSCQHALKSCFVVALILSYNDNKREREREETIKTNRQ